VTVLTAAGWRSAIALGDLPTWIQAVATVLALIAASIAAVAAWRVLEVERRRDDERRQFEDERRATDERTQAERVAAWPSLVRSDPADPASPAEWSGTIRNASDLPVYQVGIEFEPIGGGGLTVYMFEVVPPGSWSLNRDRVLYPGGELQVRQEVGDLPDRTFVIALRFTDAANRVWRRDRYGVLTRVESGP
jgi:hypothetical protein